jgi:hypothetical protein
VTERRRTAAASVGVSDGVGGLEVAGRRGGYSSGGGNDGPSVGDSGRGHQWRH